MIQVLIADDNLYFSKDILNNVINKFNNVQIKYLTTTGEETLNTIANNNIDLVFLDLKFPDCDGMDILNRINCLNSIKKPKIVIISGDTTLINSLDNNIFNIIRKSEDEETIFQKIKTIVNEINYYNNEKEIRAKIVSDLSNIGYNWKYNGSQYILESIIYIYKKNNLDLIDNLEQNVYKYIGYKHNKSVNNIKTNIIKATNAIENNDKYYKVTPKEVIWKEINIIISVYS